MSTRAPLQHYSTLFIIVFIHLHILRVEKHAFCFFFSALQYILYVPCYLVILPRYEKEKMQSVVISQPCQR